MKLVATPQQLTCSYLFFALRTGLVRMVNRDGSAGLLCLCEHGLKLPSSEEQTLPLHPLKLLEAVVAVADLGPRPHDSARPPGLVLLVPPHAVAESASRWPHVVTALRAGSGLPTCQVIVLKPLAAKPVAEDAQLAERGAKTVDAPPFQTHPGFGLPVLVPVL